MIQKTECSQIDRQPEISVIVPVYNVAQYLPACLDSILAQTFRDFEMILIEDGSTDGSREIAEAYAAKDARVRLVKHRWNHGVTAAHNLGLELSRGTYVNFVDSDDIVRAEYLEVLHRAAAETGADVVQAGFQEFFKATGDGNVFSWTRENAFLPDTLQGRVRCFLPVRIHIAPWCKLFRHTFLDQQHLQFYDVPVADDVCFHYQCLLTAQHYLLLPDVLYDYRQRAGSIANVQGLRRAERYAIAAARVLDAFSSWMQGEAAFSTHTVQQQLRQTLLTFYMHQLRDLAAKFGREEILAHCCEVLQTEPREAMFETMFYDKI